MISLRVFLFPAAVVAAALAQGQSGVEHWQLWAKPTSYAENLPRFGSGTLQGFKFKVVRRADGALPVMETDIFLGGELKWIMKKVNDTEYTNFASWQGRAQGGAGVLLTPGDYLYATPNTNYSGAAWTSRILLLGRWASEVEQDLFWTLKLKDTTVETVTPEGMSAVTGTRFNVPLYADGLQPRISRVLPFSFMDRTLFKLHPDGKWRAVSDFKDGIVLDPGTYLQSFGGSVNDSLKQMIIMVAFRVSGG